MTRNENELLKTLANLISDMIEPESVENNEFDALEQYRDKDGFINVKNVKDINEVKRIFDLTDKKNYMETLNSGYSLQDLADALAYELAPIVGSKTVNVTLDTSDGVIHASANNEAVQTDSMMPKKCESPEDFCDEVCEEVCTPKEPCNEVYARPIDVCGEDCAIPEAIVDGRTVLFDVGGVYNPEFYNAVLYICNHQYFPEVEVYSEYEVDVDDNVTTHILLPNIWGKIFAGAAEEFCERLEKGDTVFIIDPETFTLKRIDNALDLWSYAMTKTQEAIL